MAPQIDELTIKFPAKSGYLTVIRLNAAAMGSAAGLSVDDLDDLRLAVNESATWLLADEEAGGHIELALSSTDGRVVIAAERSGKALPLRHADDLIEAILGATVDEYHLDQPAADQRRASLVKVKASPDAG